jgi:hypothetical protein
MMTLDEKVLSEARETRQKLVDLEGQTAHARIDYHQAIKKLHAAGGSLREIADALELSHQRVHQIVEDFPGPWPPHWIGPPGVRGRHGRRAAFLARFDDDAREIVLEAKQGAQALRHRYLGTEHLLLALVGRGIGSLGLSADAVRVEIVKRAGEGEESSPVPRRLPFTPRSKRAMERALKEAKEAGHRCIEAEDLLLAVAADPKGTGGEVLQALGVTAEQLRERLGR